MKKEKNIYIYIYIYIYKQNKNIFDLKVKSLGTIDLVL